MTFASGGTLHFALGSEPNPAWGSRSRCRSTVAKQITGRIKNAATQISRTGRGRAVQQFR